MKHERDPSRVYIFDTTNRDGEQATEGAKHGIESKLKIARMLAEANFDRIEAGFPNSSLQDFEAVQRVAREVQDAMIFGLSRVPLGDKGYDDIDRTYEAVKDAPYRGIHVFTVMADPVSLLKQDLTRKQVVKGAADGVAYARKILGNKGQVEFSFQNATLIPLDQLVEDTMKMVHAGANVINIPDTNGYSHPEEIGRIISALRGEFPYDVMISIHCHDDLGNAVANSLAAVKAGADIVEGTINGIGERAGNTSLEEVIMNIQTRPDLFGGRTVGIATEILGPLSQAVSYHYGILVPDNKAIVGANAFRHRAGIHQDGMVKGSIYEIMDPDSVGWLGESFDLTARSGYRGVQIRLGRLGYDTTDTSLRNRIMEPYKALADMKGRLEDADLVHLMDSTNPNKVDRYHLVNIGIEKDPNSDEYKANVSLEVEGVIIDSGSIKANGSTRVSAANGREDNQPYYGAIEALYAAIDSIVKPEGLYLVHYNPVNVGAGRAATAEATVILSKKPEFDGQIKPMEGMFVGRAYHTDTLRASVMAYINALNKAQ